MGHLGSAYRKEKVHADAGSYGLQCDPDEKINRTKKGL